VNKIVAAASVIEFGLSNPDEVLQVPGQIDMGGVSVHDAWAHGVMPYTTTGIFGKSSNVGTLMLAQRIGPERYAEMLSKFGLGQRTGVGLPGESAGLVPPIDQWSGSTFSNLPIGQGLSMTLLQMTSMYQTIANDGVRIPPRIIKTTIAPTAPTPTSHGRRACGWCRRKPRRPCGRCCVRRCNTIRGATSRAPARRPPSTATSFRQDRHRAADQPRLRLLLRQRLLDHVRGHGAHRRSPLRRRHHGGQPATHGRGPARHHNGAAVPQHHGLALAAGERPLSPDPDSPLTLQAT
jgi:cell division protein FtsI (penicillin-binding protein 3)